METHRILQGFFLSLPCGTKASSPSKNQKGELQGFWREVFGIFGLGWCWYLLPSVLHRNPTFKPVTSAKYFPQHDEQRLCKLLRSVVGSCAFEQLDLFGNLRNLLHKSPGALFSKMFM